MKISYNLIQGFLRHWKGCEEASFVESIVKGFVGYIQSNSDQTKEQRGYYWSEVVIPIAIELGYENNECHDALLYKYAEVRCHRDDNGLLRVKRTSQMDKQEYSDYVDWCIRFASTELGVAIKPPKRG